VAIAKAHDGSPKFPEVGVRVGFGSEATAKATHPPFSGRRFRPTHLQAKIAPKQTPPSCNGRAWPTEAPSVLKNNYQE
jgi:hypothetical protein